jgi:hypothetical protein
MTATSNRYEDLNKITELAKGAVDTAVGLGVLGLQKLQVGRVELQKRMGKNDKLADGYSEFRTQALRRASKFDAMWGDARRTFVSSLQPVTDRLPEPARHAASVAQARIDELHAKVSEYLASASSETPTTKTKTKTSKSEAAKSDSAS